MGTMFFAIIIGFISVLLILNIIVQNPKGGGLNPSMTGSGNQVIGAQNTTNFLDKATWVLAIALAISTIGFNVLLKNDNQGTQMESAVEKKSVEDNVLPAIQNETPLETEAEMPSKKKEKPTEKTSDKKAKSDK